MRHMTYAEIRALLRAVDPQSVRRQAGISVAVIAAALAVPEWQVRQWERRRRPPRGLIAYGYARVIAGLARHLEISRSGDVTSRDPAVTPPPPPSAPERRHPATIGKSAKVHHAISASAGFASCGRYVTMTLQVSRESSEVTCAQCLKEIGDRQEKGGTDG
jgi:hypothetical protein